MPKRRQHRIQLQGLVTGRLGAITIATGPTGGGIGDVSALTSLSVNNELVRYHLTTGKIIQTGSGIIVDDSSNMTGVVALTTTGVITAPSLLIGTSPNVLDTVNIDGTLDLKHVATFANDHAFELDIDAAGFGDVEAIDIQYVTGNLSAGEDNAVILLNINDFASTGGDVFGIEILATEGGLDELWGVKVGPLIGPIHQDSGVFVNPDTATDNTASTNVPNMKDGNEANTTAIFDSNGHFIIIGKTSSAFEDIELILTTDASGAGIKPTFFYSTSGTAQFTQFFPVDGTNGCKDTGVISWDASDLTGHVADDVTGTFDIKIVRTRVNLNTTPVLGFAKVAATTEFTWDLNGDVVINDMSVGGAAGVKLSAANGVLTMLGLGDGADENLTFDFNTTPNTITLGSTSGANALDMTAFGTIVSGAISVTQITGSDSSLDIKAKNNVSGSEGIIVLQGGDGTGGSSGGPATVLGGTGHIGGSGGTVSITGGTGGVTNADGGSVTITGGVHSGSGTPGSIILTGNSEDLVLNFTANKATISTTTSVADLDFSAMNLVTTGRGGFGINAPVSPLHVYENTSSVSTATGITVEQDGAGDVNIQFLRTGLQRYVMGIDAGDNNFKMAESADLNTGVFFDYDGTDDSLVLTADVQITGDLELDGALNHDGSTVGFFGATPASQPATYIQNYTTKTRTHAVISTTTLTETTGASAATAFASVLTGDTTVVNPDILNEFIKASVAQHTAIAVDMINVKSTLNQLLADVELLGIVAQS